MGMFTAFNINATGMTAERYRMDVISENVANANTTRTADGTPYRRKVLSFAEKNGQAHSIMCWGGRWQGIYIPPPEPTMM